VANKYEYGMQGQQDAEKFLQNKGYGILERNFRVRTGEIDLIARDKNYIVFIEVKYRSGVNYGYPRESVGTAKQRKIIKTAMYYIAVNELDNQDFRFDVMEVLSQGERVTINHIENAFDAWCYESRTY
jgi:putative endonuclease